MLAPRGCCLLKGPGRDTGRLGRGRAARRGWVSWDGCGTAQGAGEGPLMTRFTVGLCMRALQTESLGGSSRGCHQLRLRHRLRALEGLVAGWALPVPSQALPPCPLTPGIYQRPASLRTGQRAVCQMALDTCPPGHSLHLSFRVISCKVWDLVLNQVGTQLWLFPHLVCAVRRCSDGIRDKRPSSSNWEKLLKVLFGCKQSHRTQVMLTWRVVQQ